MKCVLPWLVRMFPWFECCKLPTMLANTATFLINGTWYWFPTLRCYWTIHSSSTGCISFFACLPHLVMQQYLHKPFPVWLELIRLSDIISLLKGDVCDCALTSDVFGYLCHVFGDSPLSVFCASVLRGGDVLFATRKQGTLEPLRFSWWATAAERGDTVFFLQIFKFNFINQAITTFQIRHLLRFETAFVIQTWCQILNNNYVIGIQFYYIFVIVKLF
jgi:hypothetical protein